jgi:hypothetical protein
VGILIVSKKKEIVSGVFFLKRGGRAFFLIFSRRGDFLLFSRYYSRWIILLSLSLSWGGKFFFLLGRSTSHFLWRSFVTDEKRKKQRKTSVALCQLLIIFFQ